MSHRRTKTEEFEQKIKGNIQEKTIYHMKFKEFENLSKQANYFTHAQFRANHIYLLKNLNKLETNSSETERIKPKFKINSLVFIAQNSKIKSISSTKSNDFKRNENFFIHKKKNNSYFPDFNKNNLKSMLNERPHTKV